jgi:hypothetical protein
VRSQSSGADVLHHQQEIILVHEHVVDGDEVWVAQRRHDPRLPLQPLRRLGRHLGAMEPLERHLAPEALVSREKHRGGPPGPEPADHAVAPGEDGRPEAAHSSPI